MKPLVRTTSSFPNKRHVDYVVHPAVQVLVDVVVVNPLDELIGKFTPDELQDFDDGQHTLAIMSYLGKYMNYKLF